MIPYGRAELLAVEGLPAMISRKSNVAKTPFPSCMEAEQGNQIAIFTCRLIGHGLEGKIVSQCFMCLTGNIRMLRIYESTREDSQPIWAVSVKGVGGRLCKKIPIRNIRHCQASRIILTQKKLAICQE